MAKSSLEYTCIAMGSGINETLCRLANSCRTGLMLSISSSSVPRRSGKAQIDPQAPPVLLGSRFVCQFQSFISRDLHFRFRNAQGPGEWQVILVLLSML